MGEKLMTPADLIEWHQRRADTAAYNADERDLAFHEQAAACIRELVEWRPIETAPRDGTIVLTYGSLHNDHAPYGVGETPTVKISQFSPEHGAWCCDAWGSHEPVWWKPLPIPPAPGAEHDR